MSIELCNNGAKMLEGEGVIASITTLESLAAEGKFLSSTHKVPHDWCVADWKFYLDGIEYKNFNIVEMYTPGGNDGWAVVYVHATDGKHTGQTRLIRGNWSFERVGHERVHYASEKPVTIKEDK